MSFRLYWEVKKRPIIGSKTFGVSALLATVTALWLMGSFALLQILGKGTSRYKRNRDGHTKNIVYKHLNDFQVHFDDNVTVKFCVL